MHNASSPQDPAGGVKKANNNIIPDLRATLCHSSDFFAKYLRKHSLFLLLSKIHV